MKTVERKGGGGGWFEQPAKRKKTDGGLRESDDLTDWLKKKAPRSG